MSTRRIAIVLLLLLGAASWSPVQFLIRQHEYNSLKIELRNGINSMLTRRPSDVSEQQWKCAIEWTDNLTAQIFFNDHAGLPKLRQLVVDLRVRVAEPVDLGTLRWMWDRMEDADRHRSFDSCAIRFRDIRLLSREPITDESLPSLWSVDRVLMLDVSQTTITDASVPFLSSLQHLKSLNVGDTGITDDGMAEIQAALPNCKVERAPSGCFFPLFP